MAIESLAQQTSAFVDSMKIQSSDAEETSDKIVREAKTPEQGDTISVSEEARALLAVEKTGESDSSESGTKPAVFSVEELKEPEESDEETALDQTIKMLKEQIERVKQEIEELENSDMSDEMKEKLLQAKRNELAQYQDALLKAMEEKIEGMSAKDLSGVAI